jgi:hypothetical protein
MKAFYYCGGFPSFNAHRKFVPALLLALLLALAALAESFHHHDDGAIHDDCQTCLTSMHLPAEQISCVEILAPVWQVAEFHEESFSTFHSTEAGFGIRAPPSFIHV